MEAQRVVEIDSTTKNGVSMKSVLIVDDSAEVREMLKDFITMQGYKTETAENGARALEVLQKFKPDIAIVDIEMPEMNGLEFARRVLDSESRFPIIIISAYLEKYSLEYIRSLGIKSILRKPINLMQLHEEIQTALAKV